jgi:hypothetical protein
MRQLILLFLLLAVSRTSLAARFDAGLRLVSGLEVLVVISNEIRPLESALSVGPWKHTSEEREGPSERFLDIQATGATKGPQVTGDAQTAGDGDRVELGIECPGADLFGGRFPDSEPIS